MVIVNENAHLGDALNALPAIWQKSQYEKVFLVSRNEEVASLLPDNLNIIHVKSPKDFFRTDFENENKIKHLSASTNFNLFVNIYHMAQGYYPFLDLPIPSKVPNCPLNVECSNTSNLNTSFDFLISAGSHSDCNNNKLWPYENWQAIIDWLRASGYTVAALTSGRNDEHHFDNLDGNGNGLSLKEVGGAYIQKVKKAVITIDNGISHLTRMLHAPHILLYPQCLPQTWVSNPNPNNLSVQKEPLELTVDDVKKLIEIFLSTVGASV